MSEQDQYRYMALPPRHSNTNGSGNYNNVYTFPESYGSSGGYAEQQQMMYQPGQELEGEHEESQGYHEYGAPEYYAGSGEKLRPTVSRRRVTWPWYLIVPLLLLFLLMGGLFNFHMSGRSHPEFYSPSGWSGMDRHDGSMKFDDQGTIKKQAFKLNGAMPHILVNDNGGAVTIQSGTNDNVLLVTVDTTHGDNSAPVPYTFDSAHNTLSVTSSDFSSGYSVTITVPSNENVQVNQGSGDVTLNGVNGQVNVQDANGSITANNLSGNVTMNVTNGSMNIDGLNGQATLTSQSGSINIVHANLSGQSVVKAQGGSIQFDGALASQGRYDFEAVGDSVDLTLPADASFQLEGASQDLHNDFSGSTVGEAPRPVVNVNDPGGSVTITKGS